MSSFHGLDGNEYKLRLTVPLLRRIKRHAGVDLGKLETDPLNKLANDPELFVDCLWLFCESQFQPDANARDKRPDEQFAEILPDNILDVGSTALLDAIIDFFPAGKRCALRSLAETLEKKRNLATEKLMERLQTEEIDDKVVDAAVNAGLEHLTNYLNQAATNTSNTEPPISVSY